MSMILSFSEIKEIDRDMVGGKASALAKLVLNGMRVPEGVCLTVKAHEDFMSFNSLRGRILVELGRKEIKDMRWEEMWDTSQRIRNLIMGSPFPQDTRKEIRKLIKDNFKGMALAVRSSSPTEDSAKTSYAGVHESYVDVRGIKDIEKSILGVWASIWSDAALVYRKELGIDPAAGGMAVVIQRLIKGDLSGVAFSENPMDPSQMVIEAVMGLNKALVDGEVEPYRWIIDREKGDIISYSAPESRRNASGTGSDKKISPKRIPEVIKIVRSSEDIFKAPQDVEWTFKGDDIYLLQSRPITTVTKKGLSGRSVFDLSLKRSFENLKQLRNKIEKELIPGMKEQIRRFKEKDMSVMANEELASEMARRIEALEYWNKVYWNNFIPYGHGMRLFGQIYNDILNPEDPHEFVELLRPSKTLSLDRDSLLFKMAFMVRNNRPPLKVVRRGGVTGVSSFDSAYKRLLNKYGAITPGLEDPLNLADMLKKMSGSAVQAKRKRPKRQKSKEQIFLARVPKGQKARVGEILDLAKSSYIMRDDDNVYLAGIEKELERVTCEVLSRAGRIRGDKQRKALKAKIFPQLDHPLVKKGRKEHTARQGRGKAENRVYVRPKQLRGQPASKGIATGKVRVVLDASDIKELRSGEILVCDSIGPEMTYAMSLAAGIIERRGGMLIHGAIVAREYGIPCVTGVVDAASVLRTGDAVTLDGYIGLVIVTKEAL